MELKELHNRFGDYRGTELIKLQKLYDYYDGKHNILNKRNRAKGRADTKVVSGYASYITTIATAYFLGKPISYKADNGLNGYDILSEYLATEEEQKINFELALNSSVFGKAYELLYIDNAMELKSKCLDTRDVFVIKDNTIDRNIIGAVRFGINKIETNKIEVTLEVYDNTTVAVYKYEVTDNWSAKDLNNARNLISKKLHGFSSVPIIEYSNNKNQKGDFENVITYIDAYDTAVSTSIDDLTDFSDAYLVLKNLGGTTAEDIKEVKETKVLNVNGDGDAKWLIKEVNDTYSQNVKDRLNDDIHKFSFTPDMGDEKFSGNTSGVALEFKLLPLEQLGSQKEMYFKDALNQRLKLIIDYLGLKIKPTQIQKVFTRNLPRNIKEISEIMKNLKGLVSDETIISLFPQVEDAKIEMGKMKSEAEENNIYADYNNFNKVADNNGQQAKE